MSTVRHVPSLRDHCHLFVFIKVLRRPREGNIKVDLKGIKHEVVDCVPVARDAEKWRDGIKRFVTNFTFV